MSTSFKTSNSACLVALSRATESTRKCAGAKSNDGPGFDDVMPDSARGGLCITSCFPRPIRLRCNSRNIVFETELLLRSLTPRRMFPPAPRLFPRLFPRLLRPIRRC